MTLTVGHINDLKSGLEAFRVLFLASDVALHGGGSLTTPCYVTRRSARGDGVTEGILQYETLALFLKSDWDTASPGRPPGKNDVVTYQGRRYALESVVDVQPAGVDFVYRCRVNG